MVEAIFREILKCDALGAEANFFAAGGDSLRGTQVIGRLNQRLSLNLPITTIFRHPTIAALAATVDEAGRAAAERAVSLSAEIDALSDDEVARLLEQLERGDAAQVSAGSTR